MFQWCSNIFLLFAATEVRSSGDIYDDQVNQVTTWLKEACVRSLMLSFCSLYDVIENSRHKDFIK